MGDITHTLAEIAAYRSADPLAPVTVIVPTNLAGLQMRRRLAQLSAYAAVRFETMPRLAELIAAGDLASRGRLPLARPIGDYVAGQVALRSGSVFESVRELPGYARALRQAFSRLRRGGVMHSGEIVGEQSGDLAEVLRLFDLFRDQTAGFYDEEDLLVAAAKSVAEGRSGIGAELGTIVAVPPAGHSAGAHALLNALGEAAPRFVEVSETEASESTRLILAPDPASEVREVVREVLGALEGGLAVHEVAVFHGADSSYPQLLREAFASAGVPAACLPGIPLSESAMGRAVLALLNLPVEDYPRTRTMDFLALRPLKDWIPAGEERTRNSQAAWDRVSRAAGVTRGGLRWREGLEAYAKDLERQLEEDPRVMESDSRRRRITLERDRTLGLQSVFEALLERMERLNTKQPAADFIADFVAVVDSYMTKEAEGYEDVLTEIHQLGTIDAVGGSLDLGSFHEALRANLEAGVLKEGRTRLGEGVLVAEYRSAAGLSFRHVVLCGAYEGALPAGTGTTPLLDDRTWSRLRETHPFVEDMRVRLERNREAAVRAAGSAQGGTLVWACPVYEPGATRDYYPSPMMVGAAKALDPEIHTATRLRRLWGRPWLQRLSSPMGTMLQGTPTASAEVTLRQAVTLRVSGQVIDPEHELARAVEMLRSRRGNVFTHWDGNLGELSPADWLAVRSPTGPTTLENYAKCGFRYFARNILRLNSIEEPEEREMMGAADRGTLVHRILERFFSDRRLEGRPAPFERWTPEDRLALGVILDEEMSSAKKRGLTGREVFSGREVQLLRADLMRFLDMDDEFRASTGAMPVEFEANLTGHEVGGIALWGKVDRIDRTADGQHAWIIDYKTGSTRDFKGMGTDPLLGGSKLQLPAYLGAAGEATEATALYWFITHKGGFEQIKFDNTPENIERFHETIASIVSGVKAGAFPAYAGTVDDYYGGWTNCGYCEFDRMCSRNREEDFAVKRTDEGMEPWHAVASVASATSEDE